MNHRILLLDDEPNVLAALKRALLEEPYDIFTSGSGEEGLDLLSRQQVKIIISDERMPGMGGANFLSMVKGLYPQIVRIMLTGYASLESTMKAVNTGEIYRFFIKPWNDTELILALRLATEKFDVEEENRRLLLTLRRKSQELKLLEARFPGIAEVERDNSGSCILPDISDEELARVIADCCKEPGNGIGK